MLYFFVKSKVNSCYLTKVNSTVIHKINNYVANEKFGLEMESFHHYFSLTNIKLSVSLYAVVFSFF